MQRAFEIDLNTFSRFARKSEILAKISTVRDKIYKHKTIQKRVTLEEMAKKKT